MNVEVALAVEALVADGAGEGQVAGVVAAHVVAQVALGHEGLGAVVAQPRPLPRVLPQVHLQVGLQRGSSTIATTTTSLSVLIYHDLEAI